LQRKTAIIEDMLVKMRTYGKTVFRVRLKTDGCSQLSRPHVAKTDKKSSKADIPFTEID